jgi:hypothetical protein
LGGNSSRKSKKDLELATFLFPKEKKKGPGVRQEENGRWVLSEVISKASS